MGNVFKVHHVGETKLYKELKSRVEKRSEPNVDIDTLINNLPKLCEEAAQRAKLILQYFPQYTLHDETHFLRVTELMYLVLGDTLQVLNDLEICLLILSAFYHDQGMVLEGREFEELMKNEDYVVFRDNWIIDHPNYSEINEQVKTSFLSDEEKEGLVKKKLELDAALLTDYLRDTHGERGHDYIKKQFKEDKRLVISNVNIAPLLAKICISHTKSIEWIEDKRNGLSYDELIGTDEVNSIYLAIILRLADILDFDADRTPDILFKSVHFSNKISLQEWQKHRSVVGWKIKKKSILYSMKFEHPVYEKAARSFLDWIDSELYDSHTLVRKFPKSAEKYKLNIPEKVDRSKLKPKDDSYIYHDLEFSLSRDEIIKLLMTDKLYRHPSLFIRELLQNSLDALRLRKAIYAKDNLDLKEGKVIFRHYIDEFGQQVVECKDNGCGMDEEIVKKYLGKVGRSYYRSPEFERQRKQLKEKGVDFDPCSQFGIGFMSCFMVGDRIEVLTRKDYGSGKAHGKPLSIEINGLGGLFVIREGDNNQEIGTTVRVFCREKPLIFDKEYDNIQLLGIIESYALATEFPIDAVCEIEGMKDEIKLPNTINKTITYLEKTGVKCIKTFEVDFSTINKNASGFVRLSFLIDENGKPCLENSDGKFTFEKVESEPFVKSFFLNRTIAQGNKVFFRNKTRNRKVIAFNSIIMNVFTSFDDLEMMLTVCIDGIFVYGYPGRGKFSDFGYYQYVTGFYEKADNFSGKCIIDIRGDIKPELNPAREPLGIKFGYDLISTKWLYIYILIKKGKALIWGDVLRYLDSSIEVFWKLFVLYKGELQCISSDLIRRYMKLPTENSQWVGISEIKSFTFDKKYLLLNNTRYKVEFPEQMLSYFKHEMYSVERTLVEMIREMLIGMSTMDCKADGHSLLLREVFGEGEMPIDAIAFDSRYRKLYLIPFAGVDKTVVASTSPVLILNIDCPIVGWIRESQYNEGGNELRNFVYAFVRGLDEVVIRKKRDDFNGLKTRPNNEKAIHFALLFKKIDWSKYSEEYHPPYKIFVDDGDVIVITKEDFERWAK